MRWAFLCACLLLCGCYPGTTTYSPPQQFVMPNASDAPADAPLITMHDVTAPYSILEGVLDAGQGWGLKWTRKRSRFRFEVADLTGADLVIRYAMDPATLHDRGPVQVAIDINGKHFQTFTESAPGEHEQRWPADALSSNVIRTLELTLTVDPPWTAPDGNQLGIFLDAIGFVPHR